MGVSGLCKETVVNHFTDPSLILSAFNKPLVCHIATKVLCPCVDGPDSIGKTKLMQHLRQYRQAMTDLVRTSKWLLIKLKYVHILGWTQATPLKLTTLFRQMTQGIQNMTTSQSRSSQVCWIWACRGTLLIYLGSTEPMYLTCHTWPQTASIRAKNYKP